MRKGALVLSAVALFCMIGPFTASWGSDLQESEPIEIRGDYEFTEENGVVGGSGTPDDPYVIEGLKIDAGYSDYGIRIERTNRNFVIRNVEVSGAAKTGIFLSYVRNGLVENCELAGNWIGITLSFSSGNRISGCTLMSNTDGLHLYFSKDNQVLSNTVERNDYGIWCDASNTNEFIGNTVSSNHMGVYMAIGSEGNLLHHNIFLDNLHNAHTDTVNQWDYDGMGNYWYDYDGIDANEDGIGDSPYVISSDSDEDSFPLLSAP